MQFDALVVRRTPQVADEGQSAAMHAEMAAVVFDRAAARRWRRP